MSATPLRVEHGDDGVVLLTLNLPNLRNAMTAELTDAWATTIDELKSDRRVRALVVTGAGRAFCSGGDLSWIGESPEMTVDAVRNRMLPFYKAWLKVREVEVPTIAAINGAAVGAGLCAALACDLRYVASTAKLSLPFTSLGMHAGMAATFLLPQAVGVPVARELLFTGRRVEAAEALSLGLVNGVFEPEELLPGALGVARQIAANGPVAIRLTVAGLRGGGHPSLDAALQYEALAQPITFASADLTEGLAAAKEGRTPNFTGR